MNKSITEEQLMRALNISTQCAQYKWQHSTDMKIANIIAKAEDKDKIISKIESIIKGNSEKRVINLLDTL